MSENKLLLATPTEPKLLTSLLIEGEEIVTKVSIISVDFPPVEIHNGISSTSRIDQTIFNKKQDQAVMFDVVGLIVDIESINSRLNNTSLSKKTTNTTKKLFIVANEVMFISNEGNKLISINGNFDILPQELISKIYTNFPDLKSADLEELEEMLELSKDETAIKAFYKLGDYFTAKKYEINNNIFSLIEHQEKAESVAKKVLLKKMVAWEIRK